MAWREVNNMDIKVEENFFDYVKNNPDRKIIVYGMGNEARKNYKYIGRIDYFCDQRGKILNQLKIFHVYYRKSLWRFMKGWLSLFASGKKTLQSKYALSLISCR